MIRVLPAERGELRSVQGFINRDFPVSAGNVPIRVTGATWFIAFLSTPDEDQIIGYAGVSIRRKVAHFVLCKAYFPGVQALMLAAREELARSRGCERITTYTVSTNEKSIANLERAGFEVETTEGDIIWWQKWLD